MRKGSRGRKGTLSRAEHLPGLTEGMYMDGGRVGWLLLRVGLLTWNIFFVAQDFLIQLFKFLLHWVFAAV